MSANLLGLEAALGRLSLPDQLWLMERLARRIRQRSEQVGDSRERELEKMANDPAIRRELREIDGEFAATASDGLEAPS